MTDAADTALALLHAARRIFATHGFEGASVRAITADAGVNLGAITYHFGSKRELYDQVVGSIVTPLAERIERALTTDAPVLTRAGAVVEAYFAYLAENPDLPPLMMQELILGGEPPPTVMTPLRRVHGALSALIAEGQATGEVVPGPTSVMSIFILSIPVHLSIVRHALTAAGVDLSEPSLRQEVVRSARAFVEAGLRGGKTP